MNPLDLIVSIENDVCLGLHKNIHVSCNPTTLGKNPRRKKKKKLSRFSVKIGFSACF